MNAPSNWLLAAIVVFACVSCSPANPADEARALHLEENYAESVELLREALAATPDDPELNYLYGMALLGTRQRSLANWPLRRAMEDSDWRGQAALPLATNLLSLGNHDSALEVLGQLLRAEPENVDALLVRARAKLESRRDYEGALADAERAIELEPESSRGLLPRAAALLGLERLDEFAEALEELDARIRKEEFDPILLAHHCLMAATFAKEQGNLELATERFELCLEEMPMDDSIVVAAVEFYKSVGDVDRAVEIIRAALERVPQATLYRTALAEHLERQGQVDEAEQLLIEGLEVGGAPDFVVWANLSKHYQRQARHDKAVEAFEKAVESAESRVPAMLFEFAELLLMAEQYERALSVADSLDVTAMQHLIHGRVHLERGEFEMALERFASGLQLWPNNAAARYLAGRAAEHLGDFDRAIGEYRYSVRSDPNATDARLRLVQIRLAEGAIASARTESTQAADRAAPDWQAELAVLEAMAETEPPEALQFQLMRLARAPDVAGAALAASSRAVSRQHGPSAAADHILGARGVDLAQPMFVDALAALVDHLIAAGRLEDAERELSSALDAEPGSAALLAIDGRRLERSGAAAERVRRAYERALEVDPQEPRALAGLARVSEAAGQPEAAVEAYERAAAADPSEPDYRHQAARLLLSLGRPEAAVGQLEKLLREHPVNARAALALGNRLVASDRPEDLARAAALGERAQRFGGGEDADALVATARARRADLN